MTPDSLLAQLSQPKHPNQRTGDMSASKASSLQGSLKQQKGNIVEDAIMLDDDSDEDTGDSNESEVVDYFKDYVDLVDYGREIKIEGQGHASKSKPLSHQSLKSSALAQGREKYDQSLSKCTHHPKKPSDPGGQVHKVPVAHMYSSKRSQATKDASTITERKKTKKNSHYPKPYLLTAPAAQKNTHSSFARPRQRSRSESLAKVKVIAASARKNHSILAKRRAKKALAEQAAQCLRNEEKNDRNVEMVLQALAPKKRSKEHVRAGSNVRLGQLREKVAPSTTLHREQQGPAPKQPKPGSPALATPPKAPPTLQHDPTPHVTVPAESKRGFAALLTSSEALSSSKNTQDRSVSRAPFGRMVLDHTSSTKAQTMPAKVPPTPQNGPSPPATAQAEPKRGFAALPTSSEAPSSSKDTQFQKSIGLGPVSSTETSSTSTKEPQTAQQEPEPRVTGQTEPKHCFAALPASSEASPSKSTQCKSILCGRYGVTLREPNTPAKTHITPKRFNITKATTKDLPPPLPVFDPKRKRPLAHIPMGELYRPDQIVSKQGYHDHKRQRRQEKRDEALHADEHAEMQNDADAALATMADVYVVPANKPDALDGKQGPDAASGAAAGGKSSGSAQWEPFVDDASNDEGINKSNDGNTLLLIDPDVQDQAYGSGHKLTIGHSDNISNRPLPGSPKSTFAGKHIPKYHTKGLAKQRESSKAARELERTEVCGAFCPSKVPDGEVPTQLIPQFCLKRKCRMVCIICEGRLDTKRTLRNHFPKCVAVNGNPDSRSWFDHSSVPKNVKEYIPRAGPAAIWPKKPTTERQEPISPQLCESNSDASSAHENPLSSKARQTTATAPQPTIQEDAEFQFDFERSSQGLQTPAVRPTTGRKSISDATLAKRGAEEDGDADDKEDEMSEIELETPNIAYRYYVKRYELPIDQEEQPMGNTFGPFYTMAEANVVAEQEIHRLDTDPWGNYPRNWRHVCDQDEIGMRSYTVEVLGMHIETVVYRGKLPLIRPDPLRNCQLTRKQSSYHPLPCGHFHPKPSQPHSASLRSAHFSGIPSKQKRQITGATPSSTWQTNGQGSSGWMMRRVTYPNRVSKKMRWECNCARIWRKWSKKRCVSIGI